MKRSVRGKLCATGVGAVIVASCLTACAPAWNRCLPTQLTASPAAAAPGDDVTIASGTAECDLAYDDDKTYSIVLVSPSGERSEPVSVSVDEDGSFSTELAVPESFPAGNASAVVSGSPYDDCEEESASCAIYTVDFTVSVGDDAE